MAKFICPKCGTEYEYDAPVVSFSVQTLRRSRPQQVLLDACPKWREHDG